MKKDVDVSTQLAACQQQEKVALKDLEALKELIRKAPVWAPEMKIDVFEEGAPHDDSTRLGSVRLGKLPTGIVSRELYSCPGGEAAFDRDLNDDEKARVTSAFARPPPTLHVRGHAVGREQGPHQTGMMVNSSGRALVVSSGGGAGPSGAPSLPSHSFAARKRRIR